MAQRSAPAVPAAQPARGSVAAAAGTEGRRAWSRFRPRTAHPGGLVVGVACAMAAMTPSLLPRDWLYQGLVSGICGAWGYGTGVAAAWVLRRVPPWRRLLVRVRGRVPEHVAPQLWPALLITLALALVLMLVVGARWQRGMTAAIGMPPPSTADWLRAGPLLVAVAAAFVLGARGVRWAGRRVDHALEDRLRWPHAVAGVVATVVVLGAVVVVDDALLRRALVAADVAFAARNDEDHPGVARPTASERSGSPASPVPWESLGREGRRFVATGPTASQVRTAAEGAPTTVPIRVYAGIESAPTPDERAALAVQELERTGAFERSVLLVATATGSGWVNGSAVAALELVHGGDTATVATQYSYLPSWLSFLVDRSRAAQEAQALTTAVESRLAALPVDARPRLLLYGESLGSYGSESVFSSLADVRARTDGVLWVGPPHANPLWHALMERRDPGTPAAAPVYAAGLLVRFAGDREQITAPPTAWEPPRTLYLQHVDDPVVWWSPDLLLSEPDWLRERAARTSAPTVRWFPWVTFWQLTFDLLNAKSVPDGHGHNYDALALDGWAAIAPPDGWTQADTARVRAALEP